MMLLAVSALDKAKNVPSAFWLKLVLVVLAFMIGVIVLRKILSVNSLYLTLIGLTACGVLFFNWIYYRNEPAFMSPLISSIADSGFFPTKEGYTIKNLNDTGEPASKAKPAGKK